MTKETPATGSNAPLMVPHDVAAAAGLLTRLSVPVDGARAMARGARAAWAYPLVGAAVGAAQGAVYAAALTLALPVGLAAGLALASGIAVTGALHEDGLADTADGFWGGWTPARRLEIMKDSRIGAFGVLALILAILLRWQALTALGDPAAVWGTLIAAGAVSRMAMVAVWHMLPPVRPDGLSARIGQPGRATTLLAAATGTVIAAVCLPLAALIAALCAGAAVTIWLARAARAHIAGQTGDVLGAVQQLSELALLAAVAAALAR